MPVHVANKSVMLQFLNKVVSNHAGVDAMKMRGC